MKKTFALFLSMLAGLFMTSVAFAQVANPVDQMFAAIDLTTVAAAVTGVGILVVGIVMAFKGIDLAKRAVKKA